MDFISPKAAPQLPNAFAPFFNAQLGKSSPQAENIAVRVAYDTKLFCKRQTVL